MFTWGTNEVWYLKVFSHSCKGIFECKVAIIFQDLPHFYFPYPGCWNARTLEYSLLANVNSPFDLFFFLWEIREEMLICCLRKFRSLVGWFPGINVPLVFPRSSKLQILGKKRKIQPLTKFGLGRSGFVFVHCLNHIQICGLERGWSQILMVENVPLQGSFLGNHDSVRLNPPPFF